MASDVTQSAPVTVVISTLNRPMPLARCLDALLAGSRQPAAVVVVDQGGTDVGAIAAVAAAREQGLPVTHLTQPRWGLSASQNAGVRVSRTDVVAVVDDDCVPDGRWVEIIDEAFSTWQRPLLLTGRVLPLPPEGDRVAAVSTRDSTTRAEWSRPPMPWHLGTGGNFAVTRRSFEAVGGNDERLGTGAPGRGANDLDLFDHLVASGVTARFEPDLLVRHERSTIAEYVRRRHTYGFGVGTMLGLWLRRGDWRAVVVLAGWLRLRAGIACRSRCAGGLRKETRVLAGTAAGLLHGLLAGGGKRRLHYG